MLYFAPSCASVLVKLISPILAARAVSIVCKDKGINAERTGIVGLAEVAMESRERGRVDDTPELLLLEVWPGSARTLDIQSANIHWDLSVNVDV
jgi:hypothetical protein